MDPFCCLCFVFVLACCLECSLLPCAHLQGKGQPLDLLALWYMMFSCVLSLFPCGILGQVWFLILSIPDICLLHYFKFEVINEFLFP